MARYKRRLINSENPDWNRQYRFFKHPAFYILMAIAFIGAIEKFYRWKGLIP